ncbi:MAG: hypothetical protein M3O55_08800 [Actinomycetota bacterium]|nr:hypothetical protein [Actinomycetota bacterium]
MQRTLRILARVVAAALVAVSLLVAAPSQASAIQGHFLWGSTNAIAGSPDQTYLYVIPIKTTGVLHHINLGLPANAGVSGPLSYSSTIGGGATLIDHGTYIEYRLVHPYTLGAGWTVRISITGLRNPPVESDVVFNLTAWSTTNTVMTYLASYPVSFATYPVFPAVRAYAPDVPCTYTPYSIATENAKPGRSALASKPVATSGPEQVEGFADRVSATCGQLVTLRVRINDGSTSWRAELFRMGYYGGAGARLVTTFPSMSRQPQPARYIVNQIAADGTIRPMVATNWQPSLSFRVAPDMTPGDYKIRLTNSLGYQSFIPLVLRDDASTSEFVVVNSPNTYQAYGKWGGYSTYTKPASIVGNFDRPYNNGLSTDGEFDLRDYGFVYWAEQHGLNVTYTTDNDLDHTGATLRQHQTIVLLAHAEYWTDSGQAAVADAVAAGVNMINLGANQLYWRIKQPTGVVSALPNRSLYTERTGDTGLFRSAFPPEQSIFGEQYTGGWGAAGDVVAQGNWLFAGTGLSAGQKIANLVYVEVDQVDLSLPQPPGTQLLAHSELSLYQNLAERGHFSDMTFHVNPAGARIFSGGTLGWVPGLLGRSGINSTVVRQMMTNVIAQVRNTAPAPTAGVVDPKRSFALPRASSPPRSMPGFLNDPLWVTEEGENK